MRTLHEVAVALTKAGDTVVEREDSVVVKTPYQAIIRYSGVVVGRTSMGYETFVSKMCFSLPKKTVGKGKTNVGNPRDKGPCGTKGGAFDPKSKSHMKAMRKQKR